MQQPYQLTSFFMSFPTPNTKEQTNEHILPPPPRGSFHTEEKGNLNNQKLVYGAFLKQALPQTSYSGQGTLLLKLNFNVLSSPTSDKEADCYWGMY